MEINHSLSFFFKFLNRKFHEGGVAMFRHHSNTKDKAPAKAAIITTDLYAKKGEGAFC